MHKQRGFTLIELLVVISIIAILAVLVLTNLSGTRIKARNSAAKSDVTEMGKSIELYKSDDTNNATENTVHGGTTSGCTGGASCATLTGLTETGSFKAIFAGSAVYDFAGSTGSYATSITKSPSNTHVYNYKGSGGTVAARRTTATCYVISTDVQVNSSIEDGYLIIKNGTNFSGTPTDVQADARASADAANNDDCP